MSLDKCIFAVTRQALQDLIDHYFIKASYSVTGWVYFCSDKRGFTRPNISLFHKGVIQCHWITVFLQ